MDGGEGVSRWVVERVSTCVSSFPILTPHTCTCIHTQCPRTLTNGATHTEDQSAETVMQQMDQQYAPLHLVSMVAKHGTPQQLSNAKDSDLLTKERLCRALSMFEVVLKRLRDILMKDKEVRLVRPGFVRCQSYRVLPPELFVLYVPLLVRANFPRCD